MNLLALIPLALIPGGWELALIVVIVLIIFGVGKLPEVGAGLGKGIKEFKKASTGTGSGEEIDAPKAEKSADGEEEKKT